MNYQETIERLEKKQDQLLNDNATWIPPCTFLGRAFPGEWKWNYGSYKEKKIWWMIDSLKESYKKSFASQINSSKIDEAFKSVEGFDKQKEDVKGLLMFQNYAKAKNISTSQKGRIICYLLIIKKNKSLVSSLLKVIVILIDFPISFLIYVFIVGLFLWIIFIFLWS